MTVEQLAEELTNRECVLIFETEQEIEILGEQLCQFQKIRDYFAKWYLEEENCFAAWIDEIPFLLKSEPYLNRFMQISESFSISYGMPVYFASDFVHPSKNQFELDAILSTM